MNGWYCDIDEEPEVYSAVDRTARKEHRCCECRVPIVKGEKYVACSGKWDGQFKVLRQHVLCCQACMFIRDMQGECIPFGSLLQDLPESYLRDLPRALRTMLMQILIRRCAHRRATEKRNP